MISATQSSRDQGHLARANAPPGPAHAVQRLYERPTRAAGSDVSLAVGRNRHLRAAQAPVVAGIQLSQELIQGVWPAQVNDAAVLTQLLHINNHVAEQLYSGASISTFEDLSDNSKRSQLLAQATKAVGDKSARSDAQIKDLRRAVDGTPRFQAATSSKPENSAGKISIQVELKAAEGSVRQETTVLANALGKGRMMKPKPFSFYVLLTSTASGETLQVKYVGGNCHAPRATTHVAPVGGSYSVRIYSDAIAGIDQALEIA